MRMRSNGALFAALVGLGWLGVGATSATAAVNDVYALRGPGQLSCSQYLDAYEEEGRVLYMTAGWIDGYVTAMNRVEDGVFEHLSWQETGLVLDLLRNHCTANPNDVLANAVQLFIRASSGTRLTEQSELVEIPVPDSDNTIAIYKATVERVQSRLAELGHYTSTVDGAYGPGTASAIRAFQAETQLPETGLPDQRTLLVLFAPTLQGTE